MNYNLIKIPIMVITFDQCNHRPSAITRSRPFIISLQCHPFSKISSLFSSKLQTFAFCTNKACASSCIWQIMFDFIQTLCFRTEGSFSENLNLCTYLHRRWKTNSALAFHQFPAAFARFWPHCSAHKIILVVATCFRSFRLKPMQKEFPANVIDNRNRRQIASFTSSFFAGPVPFSEFSPELSLLQASGYRNRRQIASSTSSFSQAPFRSANSRPI